MERDHFGRAYGVLLLSTVLVLLYPWAHAHIPWLNRHFKTYDGINALFDQGTGTAERSEPDSLPGDFFLLDSLQDYQEDLSAFAPGLEGMDYFFEALQRGSDQVRIAWFGDSAIEGDLICQTVRDSLQRRFGGSGVGFFPILHKVKGFRQSVKEESTGNWYARYLGQREDKGIPFGIAGSYFIPDTLPGNFDSLYLHARDSAGHAGLPWETLPAIEIKTSRKAQRVKLFFGKSDSLSGAGQVAPVCKVVSGNHTRFLRLHPGKPVDETLLLEGFHRKLGIAIASRHELPLFGMSMESSKGVILDNLPARGNHGDKLMEIPLEIYQGFDSLLDYDLIILQYGLNALAAEMEDFSWYGVQMTNVVRYIKRAFPGKPILIVGPTDRAVKWEGVMQTDPSLPRVTAILKRVSQREKVAFFSFYEAMGGNGVMLDWVDKKKPRLANLDYTHLNYEGAELAGKLFLKYLLTEYDAYLAGKKHLPE